MENNKTDDLLYQNIEQMRAILENGIVSQEDEKKIAEIKKGNSSQSEPKLIKNRDITLNSDNLQKEDVFDLSIKFSNFIEERAANARLVDDVELGTTEKYREKMEKKEPLVLRFSSIEHGDLITYDGFITIVLKNININGRRFTLNRYNADYYLSRNYEVHVVNIDEENQIVYVSHQEAKAVPRTEAIIAINNALDAGKHVRAQGIITNVLDVKLYGKRKQVVYIDLFSLGIVGCIDIKDWANCFTDSLKKDAVLGDKVNVIITGKKITYARGSERVSVKSINNENFKRGKNQRVIYDCSRRLVQQLDNYDPWELIKAKKFRVNQTLRFTIAASNKNKRKFYAKIDGIPNFSAMGFWPDNARDIKVGEEYKGFIQGLDVDSHYCIVKIDKNTPDPIRPYDFREQEKMYEAKIKEEQNKTAAGKVGE